MHSMEEQGRWEWASFDLVNPATVKPRMELETFPGDLTFGGGRES